MIPNPGTFEIPGATRFRRHEHEGFHLCAVLDGGFVERSGHDWVSVGPGSLRVSGGARHDIDFSAAGARCLLLSARDPGLLPPDAPRFLEPDPWLKGLLTRIDRALAAGPHGSPNVDDLITELLAQTARRLAGRSTPPPPWVERIRSVVHEAAEPIAVSELAAEAGVHRVYLARAFREHCGVSVTGYMRRVRLARARRLLSGSLPLAEVAALAGFSDQSHMNREVRSAFGTTPGTLRNGLHPFKTPPRVRR